MRRQPPHILVTTPESLYILLGSESGRAMLATTRTVIVDEIHALAPNKRGAPPGAVARAAGSALRRPPACASACRPRRSRSTRSRASWSARGATADRPTARSSTPATAGQRDLALELPASPLEAVMSDEVWEQVYDRLAELIEAHRTTLVFVNTRRMAERVARHLAERLGEDAVAAHHGSLAKEHAARRRAAAQARRAEGAGRHRLARARHRHRRRRPGLPARLAALDRHLPAARRPLGPRGRRHAEGPAVPAVARRAGRMRGAARQRAARRARSARRSRRSRSTCWRSRSSPRSPRANGTRTRCYALVRRAWPYRAARRARTSTPSCACWPKASRTRRGRRGALRPPRRGQPRAARPARRAADRAHLRRHDPRQRRLPGAAGAARTRSSARVNEDFAVESLAGDVFQLGNTSYRILRVERGARARRGRARRSRRPSRSGSAKRRAAPTSCRIGVSRLREEIAARLRPIRPAASAAALADRRRRHRRAGREPARRLPRRGARRARRAADAGHDRARALLRRSRRHAAGHPFALRQPHQPRLGPGAAQALLPQVQLRAAGGGDRGRHRAVADRPRTASRSTRSRATCTRRASRTC